MTASLRIFYGRAHDMFLRIEKNPDGSLSVYEAFVSGMCRFIRRDTREEILRRFDVSGSIRRWLESN
jgi:hypothetical protein